MILDQGFDTGIDFYVSTFRVQHGVFVTFHYLINELTVNCWTSKLSNSYTLTTFFVWAIEARNTEEVKAAAGADDDEAEDVKAVARTDVDDAAEPEDELMNLLPEPGMDDDDDIALPSTASEVNMSILQWRNYGALKYLHDKC